MLRRATARASKLSAKGRITSACAVALLSDLNDARERALQQVDLR